MINSVRSLLLATALLGSASGAFAQSAGPLQCNLGRYTAQSGMTASQANGMLTLEWSGQDGADLRARFTVAGGQPVVRDLAVRQAGGAWAVLGENLKPEYHVVSGVRRFSSQQGGPLQSIGELTAERMEAEKWYAYRDAPLYMGPPPGANPAGGAPGGGGGGGDGEGGGGANRAPPPPIPYTTPTPEEIRRASSSFATQNCTVTTDGSRVEVAFDGLSMGIFAGTLQFTAYKGANLLRMDAIASTNEQSVAYKYDGGLSGFTMDRMPRLFWHDVGGQERQHRFGGLVNQGRVPVRTDNRVIVAEGTGGSIAAFPMPHAAFWPRQTEMNLGYSWYRKDSETNFGMGVRQAEEEGVARHMTTFELINAPPGSMQRMGMFFLMSPNAAEATREQVLAYTHGDTYKPIPGFKTMVNHVHMGITARLLRQGSLDGEARDLEAYRALGVNIVGNSEFHGDPLRSDTGAGRFPDQRDYALAMGKFSDEDFLVAPWEEPSAHFGGHYNVFWPKSVLWAKRREPDQPFTEVLPDLGRVYRTANTEEMQRLLDAEGGYWYHAHPRTKGTAGFPDHIFNEPFVRNDRYLGVAYKMGMGIDLSEIRTCEWRCFDSIDTMNNMNVGTGLRPKYIIADIDTYEKGPEDDLYPTSPVTYLRMDRVPLANEDWSPILEALHQGNTFVTTGEILITDYAIEGQGAQRVVRADLEWTFPLEFVEIVWGDGTTTGRQTVRATEYGAHGSRRFEIPINAAGKAWVRFAAYDAAGNVAFAQPQWFNPANR